MWRTEIGTPVASSNGKDGEFGDDDGGTDGGCDFFGGLDAETDVTLGITNDNNVLESSTLTSASFFLDRFDLKDFRQRCPSNRTMAESCNVSAKVSPS